MGMFDSFIDEHGLDWQTKAFDCELDEWPIGHRIPADSAKDFQVECIWWSRETDLVTKFATIRGGVFVSVESERDLALPLVDYGGAVLPAGREAW